MALTEIQQPTKMDFYHKLRSAATAINNFSNQWRDLSEFIGFVDTADLDSIGVPTGQIRTDLVNFRTLLDELNSFMDGDNVTPTNVPTAVIDKLRNM